MIIVHTKLTCLVMKIKQMTTNNNFTKMKNKILPSCLQRKYRDSLGEFTIVNSNCLGLRDLIPSQELLKDDWGWGGGFQKVILQGMQPFNSFFLCWLPKCNSPSFNYYYNALLLMTLLCFTIKGDQIKLGWGGGGASRDFKKLLNRGSK